MKINNTKMSMTICVMTVMITQIICRAIGINRTTITIYDALLLAAATTYSFTIIKNGDKNSKLNFTQRIISSILLSLSAAFSIITLTFIECYPTQASEHDTLTTALISLTLLSFFVLTLYFIIIAIIVQSKK